MALEGQTSARTIVREAAYRDLRSAPPTDRARIQAALDDAERIGGAIVQLECHRTYWLDGPLLVPGNVELRGCGHNTILARIAKPWRGIIPTFHDDGRCRRERRTHRYVIINKNGNCGDARIRLRNFALDGGSDRVGPSPSAGPPHAIGIALLATSDAVISGVAIRNVAQDGIFLKTPGGRVTIRRNIISGADLSWANGGAIIVEQWSDVRPGSRGRLRIEKNHIVVRQPRFCDTERGLPSNTPCADDSDCRATGAHTCGKRNATSAGIALVHADVAVPRLRARVLRNLIEVANRRYAVLCSGCGPVIVRKNRIRAASVGACAGRRMAGRACRLSSECGEGGRCFYEPSLVAVRANGPGGGRCGARRPGFCGRSSRQRCLADRDCAVALGRLTIVRNLVSLAGAQRPAPVIRLSSRHPTGKVRVAHNVIRLPSDAAPAPLFETNVPGAVVSEGNRVVSPSGLRSRPAEASAARHLPPAS
jgi:hypothetical protein